MRVDAQFALERAMERQEVGGRSKSPRLCRRSAALALLAFTFAGALAAAAQPPKVDEESLRIQGPIAGMRLGLRHAFPRAQASTHLPVVVMLHGAGVPVSGNPDFHLGGRSMMTALAESGLDVWALDYYGFGESDRYPEMQDPPQAHPPLGRAEDCADQLESVVDFLRGERKIETVMLIGDSGGTLVAGVYATRRPAVVARLILFGPETPFTAGSPANAVLPAYFEITPEDLWGQFTEWSQAAGKPDVLDASTFKEWAATFLRSDPTSSARTPPSVKVPNGRQADTAAIVGGKFPYDPGAIRAPTLIVMGEFDAIATYPGAQWLLQALHQAPQRRLVVIGRGSHTIQYEAERGQLYRVMSNFLLE
jgi:pimeloyl-ACP methyl ester carboxylesterase